MTDIDEYIQKVINVDTEGAQLLASLCAPTLRNSNNIDVITEGMGGIAVVRLPRDYNVIVHTAIGDPKKLVISEHVSSMMDKLYGDAEAIGATPIAMVDIVDASIGKRETIRRIGDTLVERANENNVGIINGEVAVLGSRVACEANVSGTMIGLVEKSIPSGRYEHNGVSYFVFDPKGKAVHANSDGVGTKTEFYERSGFYARALYDSLAMKLDDSSKLGARAVVVFDVVERSGKIPTELLDQTARNLGEQMGFEYILVHEDVGSRLRGWKYGVPVYNISGSAVTLIDEEMIRNPLTPSEEDYVVAIRSKNPNPRSNGITDKRKAMVDIFGENWHLTREGKIFMQFLNEPAVVFYPLFNELIDKKIVTSVTHMSGGALRSKLAKPLNKQDLYVELRNIYKPDWRELALGGFNFTTREAAYTKWPMGNDGYITTKQPELAIDVIEKYGLAAKIVGQIQKAKDGRTGVELTGIKSSDRNDIYFSGKE